MKVFIADDSELMRNRLVTLLSGLEGIDLVGQAVDCPEAINSIRASKPDVVIMDIRMPGGSGIDVLQKIKKNASSPKVIILTNYPYPQYRKKCMKSGADFFFDKSKDYVKMREVLKQLVKDSLN